MRTKVYQATRGPNKGKWFWSTPSQIGEHGPFDWATEAADAAGAARVTAKASSFMSAVGAPVFGYNPSSEAALRAMCAMLQRALIRGEAAVVPLDIVKEVVPLLIPVVPTAVRLAERKAIDNLVEKLTPAPKKRKTKRRKKKR